MKAKKGFPNVKNFSPSEFDSPDAPGSGLVEMATRLILMLQMAREISGVPFTINSGFRTVEHNKKVGGKADSSHLKGMAADISTPNSAFRYAILRGLYRVGFNRIGIASTFIHVDIDPTKFKNVVWTYNPN